MTLNLRSVAVESPTNPRCVRDHTPREASANDVHCTKTSSPMPKTSGLIFQRSLWARFAVAQAWTGGQTMLNNCGSNTLECSKSQQHQRTSTMKGRADAAERGVLVLAFTFGLATKTRNLKSKNHSAAAPARELASTLVTQPHLKLIQQKTNTNHTLGEQTHGYI